MKIDLKSLSFSSSLWEQTLCRNLPQRNEILCFPYNTFQSQCKHLDPGNRRQDDPRISSTPLQQDGFTTTPPGNFCMKIVENRSSFSTRLISNPIP